MSSTLNQNLIEQNEQQIKVHPKKQSHQIKALLYKTSTLQWKQPCTNICQIFTPIICLIFTVMIRDVAIQNLPTDAENPFNVIPAFPIKLNNFQIQNQLQDIVFLFDCSRWLLFDYKNPQDQKFIGIKDGKGLNTGMLKNIPKTHPNTCWMNESFYPPFQWSKRQIPFLLKPHNSINEDIYKRYLQFNNMTINDIRSSNAAQKMPDGAFYFNEANTQKLDVEIKVNDQRSLQIHDRNGLTKIGVRNPLSQNSTFSSYYTIAEGFLQLLDMITLSYIKQLTNQTISSGYIYMPLTSNSSILIQTLINIVATIIFPLSLSLLLPVFLYNLVLQKETKIIQMMRMNGLSIVTYWMVNFIFNCLISLLTFSVFYMFGYFYMQTPFFRLTSPLLLWTILIGWMLCQIGMSMIFQVVISNSRAANIIGYLITIWTNLVGATLSIAMYQFPNQMPFMVTLWPTISFNRLFYLMFMNCSADHCYDSFQSLPNQAIRCIYTIYISAIFFMLLGMYLFQIVPQEFGIAKNFLFPFECLFKKKSYQQMNNEQNKIKLLNQAENSSYSKQCDSLAQNQIYKVKDNKFSDYALICNQLTKVYENGKKATTDFNLILQDNQVFGLLGPNGAGKTTLISMITGIFSPSSGTAYVAGYNIKTQIDLVHMNMGVCPQFDILWEQLTVEQHLYFYARLRGTPKKYQDQKVQQTLKQVALQNFAKFKVKQLSGGMKRRLSVAISLVGDPRIVFLDQPTTGLDPQNRRNLWQLLSKCKNKRSLFLTTHLMDEAESLCDRIGIITNGRLRTVGGQLDLKKKYGNGYCLTISVQMQRGAYIKNKLDKKTNYLTQMQEQMYDDDQYERQSQDFTSQQKEKKRVSVMSVDQQPNLLVNDSITNEEYYKKYEKTSSSRILKNKLNQLSYKGKRNEKEYDSNQMNMQQSQQEQNQYFNEFNSKSYTQHELDCLKNIILIRLSEEQFRNSNRNLQLNSSLSSLSASNYNESQKVNNKSQLQPSIIPKIIKQLNGTVQFELGHNIKISKVLQQLNILKNMSLFDILNYQQHLKSQKFKQKSINVQKSTNLIKNKKQKFQFQWSINNSSLQDVFITVVKKYQNITNNHKIQNFNSELESEQKTMKKYIQ